VDDFVFIVNVDTYIDAFKKGGAYHFRSSNFTLCINFTL
jgi:hypothetical protein